MEGQRPQSHLISVALIPLIALLLALRFILLDISPPGFYVDEATGATNILCFKQEGQDWTGKPVTLFAEALGGGYSTPPFLWLGTLWTTLFGSSIAALRAMMATVSIATILGVFLLTKNYVGRESALWAALACSLSPWSIQFSRIFWDPPLHPMFLIWGLYFATCNEKHRNAFMSGLLLSFAMYSYPPARVQIPLILCLLPWVTPKGLSRKKLFTLFASFITMSAPLLVLTASGEIQGRFHMLSIFSPHYLAQQKIEPTLYNYLYIFAKNFCLHFQSSYLFFSGDSNLRHSTGQFGVMSWLDMCALMCSPALPFLCPKAAKKLLALALLAFFAGIVPSALTWESVPHALRSIGASPFLAIFTGTTLSLLGAKLKPVVLVFLLAAAGFAYSYWSYYFFQYPAASMAWFDTDVRYRLTSALTDQGTPPSSSIMQGYPSAATRYYLMHDRGMSCHESKITADNL